MHVHTNSFCGNASKIHEHVEVICRYTCAYENFFVILILFVKFIKKRKNTWKSFRSPLSLRKSANRKRERERDRERERESERERERKRER